MKISVYITSYNQKNYLIDAVESILAQTLRPHQIIIVDDASTDGSQEVIAGYASRYPTLITPVYHEQNTGVAQVRNDALNVVTGDYVTYVDGDDRFLPTKLEKEARLLLENPQIDIAFANFRYTDSQLISVPGMEWIVGDNLPPEGNVFKEVFTREFPRGTLFRSELVPFHSMKSIGFYDSNLTRFEDWDLRIRLTMKYTTGYVPEILSEVRRHDGPRLSRASRNVVIASKERVVEKNKHLLNTLSPDERHATLLTTYKKLRHISLIGIRINLVKFRPLDAWESLRKFRQFNRELKDIKTL